MGLQYILFVDVVRFLRILILLILAIGLRSYAGDMNQLKIELEEKLPPELIRSGDIRIQVETQPMSQVIPSSKKIDSSEVMNSEKLIIEKSGFNIRYSIYEDGIQGVTQDPRLLGCFRSAAREVIALLNVDPTSKPQDIKQKRIKEGLGYNKIYLQLSEQGIEPGYVETVSSTEPKEKFIAFRVQYPKCDFKTANEMDFWILKEMLHRALGGIDGVTVGRDSDSRPSAAINENHKSDKDMRITLRESAFKKTPQTKKAH